ncbi:MAG: hypothetical protein HY553_02765 [Elusimicrobia bacterium]|nr:hypothetical protein [Elusimicrobiota bacterium]
MRVLLLVLAAAAGLAALKAASRLNGALLHAVEHYGSLATGTKVTVRGVSVSPWTGSGRLRGLEVGNPVGYSKAHALRVEDIRVRLSPASLLTHEVVVREVVIDGPDVNWEADVGGGNLGRIRKALEGPPSKRKGAGESSGKRVVIERVTVRNGQVRVSALGVEKPWSFSLPELNLRDIGKGGGTREAVSQVLNAIFRAAIDAGGGAGGVLRSATKSVGDTIGGLLKKVKR